jgi:hypothetical protein
MATTDDNVISVALRVDASQLAAGMERMQAEIESSLSDLKRAFREANLQLKLAPKADPEARAQLVEYREAIEKQIATTELNLSRLTAAWDKATAKITEAKAILNAPLERGPGGQFLPRDTQSEAYLAAQQQQQSGQVEQAALTERMGRLQSWSSAAAASPGQPVASQTAAADQEKQAAAEMVAVNQQAETDKQAAIEKTAEVRTQAAAEAVAGAEKTATAGIAAAGRKAQAEGKSAQQGAAAQVAGAAQVLSAEEEKAAKIIQLQVQLAIAEQRYRDGTKQTASALKGLAELSQLLGPFVEKGNTQAAASVKRMTDEVKAAMLAEREMQAEVAAVTAELVKMGVAGEEAGGRVTGGFYKASMAGQTFREMTGVRIPRAFEMAVAHVPAVASALEAAFPILTGLMFIDILASIVDGLGKGINALRGWDEEAKKAFEDHISLSSALQRAIYAQGEALEKLPAQGLTGFAKISAEMKANETDIRNARLELEHYQKALAAQQFEEKTTKAPGLMETIGAVATTAQGPVGGGLAAAQRLGAIGQGEEHDKAVARVKELEQFTRELATKQIQLATERQTLEHEQGIQGLRDSIALGAARAESAKKTTDSLIAGEEQYTRESRKLGDISAQEEARQLRAEAGEKLAAEKTYLDAKQALTLREAGTGKDPRPELEKLNADRIAAENTYQRALSAIDTEETEARARAAIAANEQILQSSKKVADAEVQFAEQAARSQYETTRESAEHHASLLAGAAEKETATLLAAEKERSTAEANELRARAALAINQAGADAAKKKSIEDTLNKDLEALQIAHQGRMLAIQREGDQKAAADHRRIKEEQQKLDALAEEGAEKHRQAQLQYDQTAIEAAKQLPGMTPQKLGADIEEPKAPLMQRIGTLGGVGGDAWKEAQELEQIHQREYEEAKASNARMQAIYAGNLEKTRQLQEQEQAIEDKHRQTQLEDTIRINKAIANNILEMYRNISQEFFKSINEWIQGQKRFSVAMAQMWNSLVMSIIQDIEKMAAKWIEENLIMAAVAKLMQALGISTGANNSKAQAQIQQNNAERESYIDLAAATEFATQLAQSGNLFQAAAMAALAHAMGEAVSTPIAAFEQGGIVPNTGLALVHQGEHVSSAPLTKMLTNVANNGGSTSRGGDTHVHYSPTIHNGGGGDMKSLLSAHANHIGRIVSRQSKTFNR